MSQTLPRSGRVGREVKRLLVVGNGPTGIDENGVHHLEQPSAQLLFDLADLGYRVTFLQPLLPVDKTLSYYGGTLPPDRVHTIGLDARSVMRTATTSWKMLWALLRADFVYIFFPGRLPNLIARLCRSLRRPYGVFIRGDKFDEQGPDARTFARAEFILSVSQSLADRVKAINPNAGAIRALCHVTASDLYEKPFADRRSRTLRLLFVGRLEVSKGIPELLDAFARLRRSGLSAELTIVGGGDLHAELSHRFAEAPDPAIRLLGPVVDKARLLQLYEEHDILVLPTHSEGFPRVLYEAMAKSTVIVTTMVGGIPALMKDGVNCLEIPVGDAAAIAAAIERLAGDPALMARLAQAGRATVRSVFENNPPHHLALAHALGRIEEPMPSIAPANLERSPS